MRRTRIMTRWIACCLMALSVLGCQNRAETGDSTKPRPAFPLGWLQAAISLLRPAPIDTAARLAERAGAFQAQGQYALAEKHYRLALAIRENAWGAEHPNVVTSLEALATHYMSQGNYTDAEPLLTRALAIRTNAPTPQQPARSTTLTQYAELLRQTGRTREALALEQQGPDHARK